MPIYVVKEVFDASRDHGWGIEAAKEKVRAAWREVIGHRPSSITYRLTMHAWGLQKPRWYLFKTSGL